MCPELEAAVNAAKRNTDDMAKSIDTLTIPCAFKGAFMHMASERGFRFDSETIRQMEVIGKSESEVCLMILDGNNKQAGLIAAYHLAAELDNDTLRAEAVTIVRSEKNAKTLKENDVLKAILTVRGRQAAA
jgi:hypothetical protein